MRRHVGAGHDDALVLKRERRTDQRRSRVGSVVGVWRGGDGGLCGRCDADEVVVILSVPASKLKWDLIVLVRWRESAACEPLLM